MVVETEIIIYSFSHLRYLTNMQENMLLQWPVGALFGWLSWYWLLLVLGGMHFTSIESGYNSNPFDYPLNIVTLINIL